MARNENPPLDRGQTWFDGATPATQDVTDTNYLLGKEWVFEDLDYASSNLVKPTRTGMPVKCRLVRNTGAAALLGKRLVTFDKTTAGNFGKCVDGYATTTAQMCFPLDEFLGTGGLPVNDIGWLVMEGPAIVTTPLAGDATDVINIGDRLVSLTAATSGATTAGRATPIDLTGATALLGNQVLNTIGQAMSAKTTGNTGADVLVFINRF